MTKQQQFFALCAAVTAIGVGWWGAGTYFMGQGFKEAVFFVTFGPVLIVLGVLPLGIYFLSKKE